MTLTFIIEFDMQNQESDISFSDEQDVVQSSQILPKELKQQPKPQNKDGLTQREKETNEVLYIIFTNYRKDIDEIAKKYNCVVKISMSCYVISNSNSNQKEEFGQCCKEMFDFVKSINYEKLGDLGASKTTLLGDKIRYCYSLYITNTLKAKDINLTIFNSEVYAFSRKIAKQSIKKQIDALTKNKFIFPVRYNKLPNQIQKKIFYQEYYKEINGYLQKTLLYYADFFKERDVIVQLNTNKTFIYIIGQRQKYLMQAKLTMKNVVQSLVCLIIKNTVIDQKKLKQFLNTASTYPIHYGKLSENRFMIISKDNILKQLIIKSSTFFKYIGIDLSEEQSKAEANIGIFLIKTPTFRAKISKTRDVCKKKGYDLFDNGSIHYISQVFYHAGMENNNIIKSLLGDIMATLQENKQKFQTMNRMKKEQKSTTNQQTNTLKYTLKGGRIQQQNLSKLMKRDVLTEKLQMKKKYMIAFNIIQTKQSAQYWILKPNGEEGEQVKETQLKVGRYLRGFKKIDETGATVSIFQEIITIV